MSTWQQRKKPVYVGHPTLWGVVTDPPNETKSVMRFDTQEQAETYLKNLGSRSYSYILPPETK